MNLEELKNSHLHFIGIGGSGMSGLARISIALGIPTSGSDAKNSSALESLKTLGAQTFIGHARLERLYTGCRWAEGPAWFGGGRYLLWSDLPNNRIMRYDDTDGHVSVFRSPSQFANGNTVDAQLEQAAFAELVQLAKSRIAA